MRPVELCNSIGEPLGNFVVNEYEADPHRNIISDLARQRALNLPYPQMVYPVRATILSAAKFSANQMYIAAVSNAMVIHEATKNLSEPLKREDFIEAVKRSHKLPLSMPIVHLEWNGDVSNEVTDHGIGILEGNPSVNNQYLVYDEQARQVVLAKPLSGWFAAKRAREMAKIVGISTEDVGFKIEDEQTEDARVGCPVSFDPDLVKQYYEHIVDAIEHHQVWPDVIAAQKKKNIMMLEKIGLYPGMRI